MHDTEDYCFPNILGYQYGAIWCLGYCSRAIKFWFSGYVVKYANAEFKTIFIGISEILE